MNITYVSDAIYPYNKGGKEKRLFELSTRLAKLGHDVHIYTMHWWEGPEKTRVENGVTLHAISKLYPLYSGETRSIKESIYFGFACLRLMRIKFDVMDVDHMPFFPIYSAWVVCKLRGKKLYGTWHEALSYKDWTDYMGSLGIIAFVAEELSIRLPDIISSSSDQTRNRLSKIHNRSKNVHTVTPGIDLATIASSKPADGSTDVLYVGRLVKDKNIDKLVLAIAILAKTNKNVSCQIIGHGIEKDNIATLIKKLNLKDNIKMVEPVKNDKDIYAVMKSAKVFCLPSIREGFGMVVLEALGCGTPVVTIDVPANNATNLISEGKNGSLSVLEPRILAVALSKWINAPKSENIAEEVCGYDWNTITQKQEAVYNL